MRMAMTFSTLCGLVFPTVLMTFDGDVVLLADG